MTKAVMSLLELLVKTTMHRLTILLAIKARHIGERPRMMIVKARSPILTFTLRRHLILRLHVHLLYPIPQTSGNAVDKNVFTILGAAIESRLFGILSISLTIFSLKFIAFITRRKNAVILSSLNVPFVRKIIAMLTLWIPTQKRHTLVGANGSMTMQT